MFAYWQGRKSLVALNQLMGLSAPDQRHAAKVQKRIERLEREIARRVRDESRHSPRGACLGWEMMCL